MWYVMMAPCDIHTFRELLLFTFHSEKEKKTSHIQKEEEEEKFSPYHCCQLTIIVYIRFLNLIITLNSLPYSNPHTSILSRSMFTHRFLLIQAPIISLNQISIYSAMESFFPFFGDVSMTTAHTHTHSC